MCEVNPFCWVLSAFNIHMHNNIVIPTYIYVYHRIYDDDGPRYILSQCFLTRRFNIILIKDFCSYVQKTRPPSAPVYFHVPTLFIHKIHNNRRSVSIRMYSSSAFLTVYTSYYYSRWLSCTYTGYIRRFLLNDKRHLK